jgi:hypothetical protein
VKPSHTLVSESNPPHMGRGGLATAGFAILLIASWPAWLAGANEQNSTKPEASQSSAAPTAHPSAATAALPRGKKLMLKDGTFQLVREYQVEGDRVRYYSIDQMGWEEIPESLVDWEATKKEGMEEAKRNVDLIAKARATDSARHAEPLDVDASIEIAPKVFLPPGVGLFEFDGKAIYPLTPADPDIKFSTTQRLKQVLVPIPIVPTRHTVSLDGPHAKFRMRSTGVEFYMRTADAREPNLDLIRAKVHGDKRSVENLDELFNQKGASGRVVLPLLRWEVAPGVYRFTLYQTLDPGEYAVAEAIESGGTNVYLWDFGVDPGTPALKPEKK